MADIIARGMATNALTQFGGMLNAKSLGAVGDGVHDDTAALQAWISAAQASHAVAYLPPGVYLISSALQITGSVRVQGAGCQELFGSQGSTTTMNNSINFPQTSPYLQGTVIVVNAANINAIEITRASPVVDLADFGIRFATPYANTGHGIYAVPPTITKGGYDNGVMGSEWKNIKVFGHDGDHYAFYMVNPIYMTFSTLRHYGGGGFYVENNSGLGAHYGNLVFIHPYGQLYVEGAAHGYRFASTTALLNLIAMVRPQVTVADYSVSGVTAPTSSQYTLYCDSDIAGLSLGQADLETNVSSPYQLPNSTFWVEPAAYISESSGDSLVASYPLMRNLGATREMNSTLEFDVIANEPSGDIWNFGGFKSSSYMNQVGPRTDGSGGININGPIRSANNPSSFAGTSAGTAYYSQPDQANTYKKAVVVLDGYENTGTTAQTITFPTAFTYTPTITSQPSGFGATVSTTELTLPVSMSAAVSGVLIIEGI